MSGKLPTARVQTDCCASGSSVAVEPGSWRIILAYQLRDYDQRRGGNLHTIGLLAKEQGGHQHRHYDFQ
jgi:hypothetical protein